MLALSPIGDAGEFTQMWMEVWTNPKTLIPQPDHRATRLWARGHPPSA